MIKILSFLKRIPLLSRAQRERLNDLSESKRERILLTGLRNCLG